MHLAMSLVKVVFQVFFFKLIKGMSVDKVVSRTVHELPDVLCSVWDN